MQQNLQNLYHKIEKLSNEVLGNLKKKGLVVPIENDDGSISVGRYFICKSQGFYSIKNFAYEIIVDQINLPQTALIIANDLALNKFLDWNTIQLDKQYGYAMFEETLYKKIAKKRKSLDDFDIALTKSVIAKDKKDNHKKVILTKFEKLRKLV